MKKKIINMFLVLSLLCMPITGCAGWFYHHTEMPTIELPKAPVKPHIKSHVVKIGDKTYIAYEIPDSLKLYEFLVKKDAYEDMLIYRIEQSNKLIKELGKSK